MFKRILNLIELLIWRYRTYGVQSAYIAMKTRILNLYVRLVNKLFLPKLTCPCCGWRGRKFYYLDCGWFIVPEVECPSCHAHERHRLLSLLFERIPPKFLQTNYKEIRILYFAPEPHFLKLLQNYSNIKTTFTDYSPSAIFNVSPPKFVADIHALPIADNSFDAIICIHVLEHVRDDRIALQELNRVLKPNGELLLMVPFMMDQSETIEYGEPRPDIFDHVRGYSPLDFKKRLLSFEFDEIKGDSFLIAEEVERYKIPDSQIVYLCRKKLQ
ncbi:MAG: class I SAM-dependent methyltransferase [Candidatus Hydrogenedentes bacterium]|nr:class I SAM-dependent methyltransferase [Candidatus Hydrogenedentota bacterium]